MRPVINPSNRYCTVEWPRRFSARRAKQEIYSGNGVQDGFMCMATPAAASTRTAFKVYTSEKELTLGAALFDTAAPRPPYGEGTPLDDLEIHFDPYHDHLGFFQFLFTPGKDVYRHSHWPYAAAHSTSFPRIKLKRFRWEPDPNKSVHWFFVTFALEGIFRSGDCCGFQVTRASHVNLESGSWNHCSGNGHPDATSFGHLYLRGGPRVVTVDTAELEGNALELAGTVGGKARLLSLEVRDPLDRKAEARVRGGRGRWRARVELAGRPHGRYRIYPKTEGGEAEPGFFHCDLPAPRKKWPFKLCMTHDIPDNVVNNFYTPQRMDKEWQLLSGLGVERIHWLDYSNFPGIWKWRHWSEYSVRSIQECGDLFRVAARLARKNGLEIVGLLKPFDLGFNDPTMLEGRSGMVAGLEQRPLTAIPEIERHQEWTMQANPEWSRATEFPVTALRFFSQKPIPTLRSGDIQLWVSADNRKYTKYRGAFTIHQESVSRPHHRWTPAGKEAQRGRRKEWLIQLSRLKLRHPFVAIEIRKGDLEVVNQTFVFAEADDASSTDVELVLSTDGSLSDGFSFWREWPGWANRSERMLEDYSWRGERICLALGKQENLPTLLEPSYEGAREVWLARLEKMLRDGADGVGIRTLCHHNSCPEWLRYAFAEPVRDAFRQQYGREVQLTPEDYERVRRIRGEFYTQFLRDAKALTARYGKPLSIHFESGIEVPPQYDTRMQVHLDWGRWLDEGLMDAIYLKFWCSQSPFVHEKVLPVARRKEIPVTICDRNGFIRTPRGIEFAERFIREAHAAGFSGYTFYETADYVRLNPAGVPTPVRHTDVAIRRAGDTAAELRGVNQGN